MRAASPAASLRAHHRLARFKLADRAPCRREAGVGGEESRITKGGIMLATDIEKMLILLGVVAAWILLSKWVFPKLGLKT